jgi:methyl-accepting chemotaxis protein
MSHWLFGAQVAATQATGEAVQAIESIGGTIGAINQIATAIALAVQQNSATRQIGRNVQEAAQVTGKVSSNMVGVNEAAGPALASAEQLSGQADHCALTSTASLSISG